MQTTTINYKPGTRAFKQLAVLGATMRFGELNHELSRLKQLFPHLNGAPPALATTASATIQRPKAKKVLEVAAVHHTQTPEARRAQGRRARKFWRSPEGIKRKAALARARKES